MRDTVYLEQNSEYSKNRTSDQMWFTSTLLFIAKGSKMKFILVLFFIASVFGQKDICKDSACENEGSYTEIVVRNTENCPSEMPEIKTIERRAAQTYDHDEGGIKKYSLKKQAKQLCKNINKIDKIIEKGLVSTVKFSRVELRVFTALPSSYYERDSSGSFLTS